MSLRVLHDRLLVRRVETVEEKKGELIMLKDTKALPRGVVTAVGTGRLVNGQVIPVAVNVGDTVIYRHNAGMEIEGQILLSESDLLAVVEQ
jgi:chaperonin GroES